MRVQFITVLSLLGLALQGQTLPFRVGESLHYIAQFNLIPAGKASLEVLEFDTVDTTPVYHVVFTARTGKIADRIYKIRDQIHTWINQRELYTHRQKKVIREGSYRLSTLTRVDYDNSIAITGRDTFRISSPLRDFYSLFYYLRTIPLEVDSILDFAAFDNNRETHFRLKIAGREEITVPAGTFSCLKIKPFRKERSLFKNQGDMEIWFSDDDRRLPVQIQIHLKYGSMLLRLDSYTL
ncbi:MAG: DUF3108 domain-containing protein [FCB group bacterium]|nr:DUF3108 domain-containing protein [FCB group bacterium]